MRCATTRMQTLHQNIADDVNGNIEDGDEGQGPEVDESEYGEEDTTPGTPRRRTAKSKSRRSKASGQGDILKSVFGINGMSHGLMLRNIWATKSPLIPRREFFQSRSRPRVELRRDSYVTFAEETEVANPDGLSFSIGLGQHTQLQQGEIPFRGVMALPPPADGFLAHTGVDIQCLDWAPTSQGGQCQDVQYIALAGRAPGSSVTGRVFTREAEASSIQIWAIQSQGGRLANAPRLAVELHHEWGVAWNLRWGPSEPDDETIGRLAAVFSAGETKLFQVPVPVGNDTKHYTLRSKAPSFQVPHGLPTCVCWYGHDRIVVGYDHGYLAVWGSHQGRESSAIPQRYFRALLIYVYGITTCGPSFPHYLLVNSLDGSNSLIDLRAPSTDTLVLQASKLWTPGIAWCDLLNTVVSAESRLGVRVMALRDANVDERVQSMSVGRHSAAICDVEASPWHPFILSAGSDGVLQLANLAKKVIVPRRTVYYTQRLFEFQYAPALQAFRMLGPFAPTEFKKARVSQEARAIYPPEASVKAVRWNVNRQYASWYAAGAYCLLRIEDLDASAAEIVQ